MPSAMQHEALVVSTLLLLLLCLAAFLLPRHALLCRLVLVGVCTSATLLLLVYHVLLLNPLLNPSPTMTSETSSVPLLPAATNSTFLWPTLDARMDGWLLLCVAWLLAQAGQHLLLARFVFPKPPRRRRRPHGISRQSTKGTLTLSTLSNRVINWRTVGQSCYRISVNVTSENRFHLSSCRLRFWYHWLPVAANVCCAAVVLVTEAALRDENDDRNTHVITTVSERIPFMRSDSIVSTGRLKQQATGLQVLLLLLLFIVCALVVTVIVLVYTPPSQPAPPTTNPYDTLVTADTQRETLVRQTMLSAVDGQAMLEDLNIVSSEHHLSGSPANQKVAEYIIDRYKSLGYDVRTYDYEVMASMPHWDTPNTVHIRNSNNSWSQLSDGLGRRQGPPEAQAQMDNKTQLWWNAWSTDGQVNSTIVYCNYATDEDFDVLWAKGIAVNGSIALVRMGGNWRGNKVYAALVRGAIGVILYMDPADYAADGQNFPNGMFEPSTDAQRGSTKNLWGDILTPVYPSKPWAYRAKTEQQMRDDLTIPNAPVTTISYGHAVKIMNSLDGPEAPSSFIGGMSTTYRLSGQEEFSLTVHANTTQRQPITNICAFLYGSEQPDYMVINSNHYDSYTNGALDPNSGTGMQMEVARLMMLAVNTTDWTPRRTQVFCHWDAEEYGLIGSGEWVQDMEKLLNARAVAVVNTDMALYGNVTLDVEGTPQLQSAMVSATSVVPNPNPVETAAGRSTAFDSWHKWFPSTSAMAGLDPPLMYVPGAGSDHYTFMTFAAVPVISYMYANKGQWQSFKLYHSMYEVPWTVDHLVDRGGRTLSAMASITAELDRLLIDSPVGCLNSFPFPVYWLR